MKCNHAVKSKKDQDALLDALLTDKLDIIATDHAPHTLEEKSQDYIHAPSGLPLVQHSLLIMMDFYQRGKITMEEIVRKMCHAPADMFDIDKRGYIDEGYFADLVVVDPTAEYQVNNKNIAFKCGWSPLEGKSFKGAITDVFVNGVHKVEESEIVDDSPGERLLFNR